MITNFNELFEALRNRSRKRMIAAWGVDDHTITAASRAIEKGIVDVTLVGDKDMILAVCEKEQIDPTIFTIIDNKNELDAIAQAVAMVKDGQGDILMKGLCSTDKYMRGILNKERGLLPPKAVLSHVSVVENPNYHKLIILGDMAVIPAPDFKQKQAICKYLVATAKAMGIAKPKVAAIAATEQMLDGMPACVEAALLAKMSDRGQIAGCVIDGPLALDVAIDPSRRSRAKWPATPTASSSRTSRAPMCSTRSTRSCARASARPPSWPAPRRPACSPAEPTASIPS